MKKTIKKKRDYCSYKKVKTLDITNFTRQLATLLTAGISLIQALDLLKRSSNKSSMQSIITKLKNKIERGHTVAEALREFPQYFNPLYRNLIAVGERSGTLDRMLERIATYKEKMAALKRKINKALFYPAAVLSVAVLVTIAMLVFVVPQFASLYAGFGAALPLPTQVVITIAKLFQHEGLWLIAFMLSIAIGLRSLSMRYSRFIEYRDRSLLHLPVIGAILTKAIIARFARTLATTFAAGLSLDTSLEAVSGAAGNYIYQQAALQIRHKIITGQTLQQAMRDSNVFPNMVIQMIAIGEEAGALEKMLDKIASMFEVEVEYAIDNLSNLLEPLIMIILGILIGGLVIAMYLPIFKLGSVV